VNELGEFTIRDTSASWTEDEFKGQYVYLVGLALDPSDADDSFYEITRNTADTLYVGSPLPSFFSEPAYRIITNPASQSSATGFPSLELTVSPGLNAQGEVVAVEYTLSPGENRTLNQVDVYIAVSVPPRGSPTIQVGTLRFLRAGKWRRKVVPIAKGVYIGTQVSGIASIIQTETGLAKGEYIIYGLLNTPDATLFDMRFWRSDLARASFYVR
jgi:hypothetical protein